MTLMAFGGRRRLVKLLASGENDPARLMAELSVGPLRLALLLESPSVRSWRAGVEYARRVLDRPVLEGVDDGLSDEEALDELRKQVVAGKLPPAALLRPLRQSEYLDVVQDLVDLVEAGKLDEHRLEADLRSLLDRAAGSGTLPPDSDGPSPPV